jgi:hypothetical protein
LRMAGSSSGRDRSPNRYHTMRKPATEPASATFLTPIGSG